MEFQSRQSGSRSMLFKPLRKIGWKQDPMHLKGLDEVFFLVRIFHFFNHQKHKTNCLYLISFSSSTHSVDNVEKEM